MLLLNGACEAFWLLAAAVRPRLVACVHPGFTEPEAAFRAAGCEVVRVFREPESWRLDPADVPDEADVVVVGNPENPIGTLEARELLARLQRPGRLVVVDESFMEFALERETLAGDRDVVVVRSLTKLWSLAGIRAGYLLGPPALVAELDAHRQPWSVNALACAAVVACCGDRETPARVAAEVEAERRFLAAGLERVAQRVWPGAANFLLHARLGRARHGGCTSAEGYLGAPVRILPRPRRRSPARGGTASCRQRAAARVGLTFLLGGARSGKSSLAVELARASEAPVVFIATGEAGDEEMAERIERHRAERPAGWTTVEEPRALADAIAATPDDACVVVDCLSLWVANTLDRGAGRGGGGGGPRLSFLPHGGTAARSPCRTRSGSASCRRRRSAAPTATCSGA